MRSTSPGRPLVVVCLLASSVAAAAERATTTIALTSTCPAAVLDAAALEAALRIELQSTLGGAVTFTHGDDGAASYTIDVACATNDAIDLTLRRAQPPGQEQQRIGVGDIDPAARPRAIAIAIAEGTRAVHTPPAPTPTPAPSATSVAMPPPAHAEDPVRRRRLLGGLAIGFGALTVAGAVIGGSLFAAGNRDPANSIPGLTVPGATLLAIGGGALVATGVTFGLWLRERRR